MRTKQNIFRLRRQHATTVTREAMDVVGEQIDTELKPLRSTLGKLDELVQTLHGITDHLSEELPLPDKNTHRNYKGFLK